MRPDCDAVYATKTLSGGRCAYVTALTFGRARIGVGSSGSCVYDDIW